MIFNLWLVCQKSLDVNKSEFFAAFIRIKALFSRGELALHFEDANIQLCSEQGLPGFHSGAERLGRHMCFECLL